MDVDVSSQSSILRRTLLCPQRAHDRVVLRFRDQAITQATLGVCGVWITEAKRKIERTLVILCEDIEVTFRSPPISLPHFVADRTRSQANAICPHEFICREQK